MIANLIFDAKVIESHFSENGVTVNKSTFEEDGKIFTLFEGNADPDHPFWKKIYPEGMDYTQTLRIIQDDSGNFLEDLNFDHNIEYSDHELVDQTASFNLETGAFYTWQQRMDEYNKPREQWDTEVFNCQPGYGVADNTQQVFERFRAVIDNPHVEVVFSFTSIVRKDEPEQNGWRWHKWGEYIGTHQINHEYLYDEEGIEQVLVYQVYPVKKKETK